jgi:hypothetical protein
MEDPIWDLVLGHEHPGQEIEREDDRIGDGWAASSLGIAAARANPRHENEKTPMARVTSSAGRVSVGIVTP